MQFQERESSGSGGKNFLKIKDGEEVRGLFMGDPHVFEQHWKEGKGIVCKGKSACPICKEGGKGPSFRFTINFIVKENGAYTAKIWQGGGPVWDMLRELNTDYPLDKTLVKIKRKGINQETKYTVTPVPNGALSVEQLADVGNVPLNSLVQGRSVQIDIPPEPQAGFDDEESLPF